MALATLLFGACSSDDNENVVDNKDDATTITTSTAKTYVSIFADKACTTPIVENVALTKSVSDVNMALPLNLSTVYVQYPTSNGTKVFEQSVNSTQKAMNLQADPGSYNYMQNETEKYTTLQIAVPDDAVKNYVTNKETVDKNSFTNYHSSGVVMFEDTWPSKSNTDYLGLAGGKDDADKFGDLNDCVVDYDLESTVMDAANASAKLSTWEEDLKVVMHVRAMGGKYTQKFGLLLEGLDKQYVNTKDIPITITLGNYNKPAKSLDVSVEWQDNNPIIWINDMYNIHDKTFMTANGLKLSTVPNPSKLDILSDLYNVANDDNMNVGKGLFTITVTFRGKTGDFTDATKAAQTENFKNAVINTRAQNFFIVTKQNDRTYESHLAGYEPTKSYASSYDADKTQKGDGVAVAKDASVKYLASDGRVWGIKAPTLTRHATEHTAFTVAYPQYELWRANQSNSEYQDWFTTKKANMEVSDVKFSYTGKMALKYIIEEW